MTKLKRSEILMQVFLSAALVAVCLQRPLRGHGSACEGRSPLSAELASEARRMIREFPNSRYSHKTHIDRKSGKCEVDCSGFIGAIFKHVSPEHLAAIRTTRQRPLADDFYHAFARGGCRGWKQIQRVQSANVGDVIAWLKLDRKPGDNTGHVMLLAEKPVMVSPTRARLRVYDSTVHGHGHDTRPEGKSGIGEGTIWLELNPNGNPIAFHWKSVEIAPHDVPIRIGRAVSI
jgi:hypothetical protein